MKKVLVVGIGPGEYEQMTIRAASALREAQVIVGYTVYVDLVREHFPGKRFLTTPMTQEAERCQLAFQEAMEDQTVAMICSGDGGVYGMSGLIYEVGQGYPQVEIEVIPGVTAALSGGAVLGAPLIHDFAVISLSDLLTPWEKIEKRLLAAAEADFAICLYNPSSRKRKDYLRRPATCCSGSAVRRRFAAQSATSEGPGKAPRCVPWPSSGSWRRTCLPRCLWATPRPGSLGAIW